MEVLKNRETLDLCNAIQEEKPDYQMIKKHLVTLISSENAAAGILECFMAKVGTAPTYRCLARIAASAREELLASSGERAVFWFPELDKRDSYSIIWIPQAEAEDHKEALRVAKGVASLGVTTRIDKAGVRRYGIRAAAADKDKAAKALGRPTGLRYYVKQAPIEWVEHDVLEFAKQIKWTIDIPNPSAAVRIRRGMATWTIRASALHDQQWSRREMRRSHYFLNPLKIRDLHRGRRVLRHQDPGHRWSPHQSGLPHMLLKLSQSRKERWRRWADPNLNHLCETLTQESELHYGEEP